MTLAFRPLPPSRGYAIDCRRATIQAYARSVATVLNVSGVVDSLNEATVYRHLSRFNRLDTALIIDISEARLADLGALCDFVEGGDGDYAQMSKAIVATPEVAAALRHRADGEANLVFTTVPDAVQFFVRTIAARRNPGALQLLRPA
jgi:hypothetical protein